MRAAINEVETLKEILMNNYIDKKNPVSSMRILIKYLYWYGYDKKETKEIIQNYISHKDINLNKVLFNDRINSAITYIYNNPTRLVFIDSVSVTGSELSKIVELNNENREKVAFAYLIHSKINNKKYNSDKNMVYSPTADIIKESLCNKPVKKQIRKKSIVIDKFIKENPITVVGDLVDLGYLEQTRSTGKNTNKSVLFVNETSEAVLEVKDFDNYINYYLKWRYGTVDVCECGVWYQQSSNRKSYCESCLKGKQLEWQRESMKKYRENKNVK